MTVVCAASVKLLWIANAASRINSNETHPNIFHLFGTKLAMFTRVLLTAWGEREDDIIGLLVLTKDERTGDAGLPGRLTPAPLGASPGRLCSRLAYT